MSEISSDAMKQRVERLEREEKWWRRGALLLVLLIGASVMMGQGAMKPRIIEADGIVLKDADGAIRPIFGRSKPGDDVSKPFIPALSGGTYGVHLYGSDGRYRAGLMVHENREVTLALYSQEHGSVPPSRTRVLLGVRGPESRGLPILDFMDEEGKTRLELGYIFDLGGPIKLPSHVGPALRIYDQKGPATGKIIWKAP